MYEKEIGNLIDWLESWNYRGAYKGPVIHRLSAGRTFLIHETEWTQAAMIEGYLNLFENMEYKNVNIDISGLGYHCEEPMHSVKFYRFKREIIVESLLDMNDSSYDIFIPAKTNQSQ